MQNSPRIQRQSSFSVSSSISNSIPPICSSAWLAKCLYHAHSLAFHSISDLFLLSCYSVTTMQLFKSLLMFLPSKLIILKIFFLLTCRGFCCWGLCWGFFIPSVRLLSTLLQCNTCLYCCCGQLTQLALTEIEAGACVKTNQWNWQGWLAILHGTP